MTKAERLNLLKSIGEKHRAQEDAFGELAISKEDVNEEVINLDTFREQLKQEKGQKSLTSDEG